MDEHTSEIANSILIDEYSKCIFDSNEKKSSSGFPKSNVNVAQHSTENEKKWKPGMNVRAIYSEDKEYYEAIIKTIIDDRYATVCFLGYENEEEVDLNDLQQSNGEKSIEVQLENAANEQDLSNNEDDECNEEAIEWKLGMQCRALYDVNNVIYEATILEIDAINKTALLNMTGFNKNFVARFEEMYESIPEYRIKQENVARKMTTNKSIPQFQENTKSTISMSEIYTSSDTIDHAENLNKNVNSEKTNTPENSESKNSDHKIHATSDTTNHSNKDTASPESFRTGEETKTYSNSEPKFSIPQHLMQSVMHPETESEALACLISSSYLSGYYAGYYDCMMKLKRKSEE